MVLRRSLTEGEREELKGIVSLGAIIGRAVIFIVVVGIVGLVCWNLNQAKPDLVWWPVPVLAAAMTIFVGSKRLTGGLELRDRIRKDLQQGEAEVRVFSLNTVVVFREVEDEGPVWFFRDGARNYALSGQRTARLSEDGLPRVKLTIAVAPASERILELRSEGANSDAVVSAVPFFKSTVYDKRVLAKPLNEVAVNWEELIASAQRGNETQSRGSTM